MDVQYMNDKTEAIVKLNETIKFESERRYTISDKDVKIVGIRKKRTVPLPIRRSIKEGMVHVPRKKLENRSVIKDKVPVAIPGSEDLHKEKTDCAAGPRAPVPRCPSPEESNVTELVRCPSEKQELLRMLLPHLQQSLPNCSLKIVPEGIELIGASRSVKQAKLEISEKVFNFISHAISDAYSQRAKLLLSDGGQQHVQELFSKAETLAVLSVRDHQLWLTATDAHQVLAASKTLEKDIHMFDIPVEDFHHEFLQSECKQLIEDLENKYMVAIGQKQSTLVVEAMGNCGDEVMVVLREALNANAQQTEDILLEEDDWKLLNNHYQADIDDLGRNVVDR